MSFDSKSLANLERTIALNDFSAFRKLMLGRKIAPMHKQIEDAVLKSDKHVRVMAARQLGKTTSLVDLIIWICWITNKSHPFVIKTPFDEVSAERLNIAIVSHNMPQSTSVLAMIKDLIADNPLLLEEMYPTEHLERKWGSTHIKTKAGHNIYCLPFTDSIRGRSLHLCFLDDVLQSSEINIDSAKDLFWGVVYPTVGATKGKLVVSGTPMSFDDLLFDLSDEGRCDEFISLDFPAIIEAEDGSGEKPQFPELYTLDALRSKEKLMPPHLWSREYMLKPVSSGSAFFPYEWIEKAEREVFKDEIFNYYCGVDVAMSTSKDADYTVVTVLGEHSDNKYTVVETIYRKGLREEGMIEILMKLDMSYRFRRVCVEQVGISYGLVLELMDAPTVMYSGHLEANPFRNRVFGYKTGSSFSNQPRDRLLSMCQQALREGRLALPDKKKLVTELKGFTVRTIDGREKVVSVLKHDDAVLSLGMALEAAYFAPSGVGAAVISGGFSVQDEDDGIVLKPEDFMV